MKTISKKQIALSLSLLALSAQSALACEFHRQNVSCGGAACVEIDVECSGVLTSQTTVLASFADRTEASLRQQWEPKPTPSSNSSSGYSQSAPGRPPNQGVVSNGGGFNAGYGAGATRTLSTGQAPVPFSLGPTGL